MNCKQCVEAKTLDWDSIFDFAIIGFKSPHNVELKSLNLKEYM